MRIPDAFTPLRIGLGLALVGAIVLAIVFWNPLTGYLTSRLAKAEAETETAQDGLQGQIEANLGQADVERAAQEVRVIVQDAREVAHDVEIEARRAPNGEDPLEPDVYSRLRLADDRLCDLRPSVCSGSPDGAAARPGDAE